MIGLLLVDFISKKLYFEAFNFSNELIKEVSYYSSKNIEQVKCFDIEKYVKEVEDVEFVEYTFQKQLKRRMLGSISKVDDEVIITTNKELMLERKNFTKMHEIMHYYRDIPYINTETHTFSDMMFENGYFPEALPKEYRANVGASILMANDTALHYAIKKFHSFKEVADYFFMSKSALRNRIIEHLIYINNCTPQYAFSLFNDYFFGSGKKFRRNFFNYQQIFF
ncbi:ImmA/IrrE family metallo-endopeptidase [Enterococcus faecalis]|uniref:ImmA/IrrE family metallo-endopeptidase n=1 Tax=Enterococcus faecalis TaxID=1351 RepID=UPI00232C9511|nr:ImmA/IrrE family metallo-endopeptidase [Enterococcus faecalis]MDB1590650.1 ImmA/IrrE family metallo-endopeptidase [Enterococcus faecalis]MDB1598314.1 ImmA/IrrE family metallo-endopeptidase [Enterococcus faecalis]MDB1606203.1 ImmA/IrrE family metallo-endopeptidase [Enterococcus faecalis]MDB1608728.1 ImmA/IrrE family metallo-endopeptidase [Enterococcus faecalis]MDB1611252.1 ImmA/IrrE family metallo-endopeptidase [Enterococcus faecalis]